MPTLPHTLILLVDRLSQRPTVGIRYLGPRGVAIGVELVVCLICKLPVHMMLAERGDKVTQEISCLPVDALN